MFCVLCDKIADLSRYLSARSVVYFVPSQYDIDNLQKRLFHSHKILSYLDTIFKNNQNQRKFINYEDDEEEKSSDQSEAREEFWNRIVVAIKEELSVCAEKGIVLYIFVYIVYYNRYLI